MYGLQRGAWMMFGVLMTSAVWAAEASAPKAVDVATVSTAELDWGDDYAEAMREAEVEEKMLLVYFRGNGVNSIRDQFETKSLTDPKVQEKLREHVLVRLPLDAEITVKGVKSKVISHRAFLELEGKEGIALIDFVNRGTEHYGYVVSSLILTNGRYYHFRPDHLAVMLDLPAGTLTQRTMVFAVRIHPEAPASTVGQVDGTLLKEAESHSGYQAQIGVQGHHHWDSRYQRISGKLPGGMRAQEVVAESWPHQSLLDAACDCVHSWRQSSGHWGAVRARQPRFGYDMRRGSNGIWYATGLFGNRH